MNKRYAAIGALLGGALSAQSAAAEDLMDVYQLAKESDPTIREAKAQYQSASEALPQARSALLPQITASASKGESTSEGQRIQQRNGQIGLFEQSTSSESTSYAVSLTQTLFDWAAFSNWQRADHLVAQAEARYKKAQQNLIVRTAEAYFTVLNARADLEAVAANKTALKRQLEQTQKRFEVGLIATTDVQEARAAYDRAVADHIAARRALSTAEEDLHTIINTYPGDLAAPDGRIPLQKPDPADEKAWVEQALNRNFSVAAKRFELLAASENVDAQRAGHYPTLNLNASERFNETDTDNAFAAQDTTTDSVSISLSVPLFSGGRTHSQYKQAVHDRTAVKEALTRTQRQTVRDIRDAYLGVLSEISRVKALRQAVESSKTALEATQAGLEVGTRTTVDVLDARRGLVDAQRNFAQARYNYLLNTLKLKAAAGSLTEADLKQINDWFTAEPENADS